MFITYVLITALAISLLINIYFLFQLLKPIPPKESEHGETELLKDILNGKALVQITRIAPENFFLRRPN